LKGKKKICLGTILRRKKIEFFSPCENLKEKKKLIFFLMKSRLLFIKATRTIFFEDILINIHELINMNISADGHLITFV